MSAAPSAGPRLPYVEDQALVPGAPLHALASSVRARRGGRLLNLDRMLLHSAPFAAGWNSLLGAIRTGLSLDPVLRELAICAIAQLNTAPYEWHQHVGEWESAGARPEQLRALQLPAEQWLADPAFDSRERLVLELTLQSTCAVAVEPQLITALTAILGSTATVELVGTVAAYNMVSRFLVALGIDAQGEQTGSSA
jgi:alkylhydroperoxidase family enzyme